MNLVTRRGDLAVRRIDHMRHHHRTECGCTLNNICRPNREDVIEQIVPSSVQIVLERDGKAFPKRLRRCSRGAPKRTGN